MTHAAGFTTFISIHNITYTDYNVVAGLALAPLGPVLLVPARYCIKKGE